MLLLVLQYTPPCTIICYRTILICRLYSSPVLLLYTKASLQTGVLHRSSTQIVLSSQFYAVLENIVMAKSQTEIHATCAHHALLAKLRARWVQQQKQLANRAWLVHTQTEIRATCAHHALLAKLRARWVQQHKQLAYRAWLVHTQTEIHATCAHHALLAKLRARWVRQQKQLAKRVRLVHPGANSVRPATVPVC